MSQQNSTAFPNQRGWEPNTHVKVEGVGGKCMNACQVVVLGLGEMSPLNCLFESRDKVEKPGGWGIIYNDLLTESRFFIRTR